MNPNCICLHRALVLHARLSVVALCYNDGVTVDSVHTPLVTPVDWDPKLSISPSGHLERDREREREAYADICSSDSCLTRRSRVLRPVHSARKRSQWLSKVRMSGSPLSPKFPTVALSIARKHIVHIHHYGDDTQLYLPFQGEQERALSHSLLLSLALSCSLSLSLYLCLSLSLSLSVSLSLSRCLNAPLTVHRQTCSAVVLQ